MEDDFQLDGGGEARQAGGVTRGVTRARGA